MNNRLFLTDSDLLDKALAWTMIAMLVVIGLILLLAGFLAIVSSIQNHLEEKNERFAYSDYDCVKLNQTDCSAYHVPSSLLNKLTTLLDLNQQHNSVLFSQYEDANHEFEYTLNTDCILNLPEDWFVDNGVERLQNLPKDYQLAKQQVHVLAQYLANNVDQIQATQITQYQVLCNLWMAYLNLVKANSYFVDKLAVNSFAKFAQTPAYQNYQTTIACFLTKDSIAIKVINDEQNNETVRSLINELVVALDKMVSISEIHQKRSINYLLAHNRLDCLPDAVVLKYQQQIRQANRKLN